jgi:large subunit ribosomal protein L10
MPVMFACSGSPTVFGGPFLLHNSVGGEKVARPDKVAAVAEIKDKLSRAQSVVLADYRGLNVAQATELRKQLREAGIEYKVVKNTLTIIAARECGLDGLASLLTGPTAIAFGYDDPVAPAKILSEFAKANKDLELKGGVLDGQVMNVEDVKALADLPSREELLAQVLRGMQAPIAGFVNVLQGTIRNFVYALDAVRKQKEEAGA